MPTDAAERLYSALPNIVEVSRRAATSSRARESRTDERTQREHIALGKARSQLLTIVTQFEKWRISYAELLGQTSDGSTALRVFGTLTAMTIRLRERERVATPRPGAARRGRKRDHLRHHGLYVLHFWWRSQEWPMRLSRASELAQRASALVTVSNLFATYVSDLNLKGQKPKKARDAELRWARESADLAWRLYERDGALGVLPPGAAEQPLLFLDTVPLRFEMDCRPEERARRRSRRARPHTHGLTDQVRFGKLQ